MKGILALCGFLAYLAAVVFFGLLVFDVQVDTNLLADGLLCCAIGFALHSVPVTEP